MSFAQAVSDLCLVVSQERLATSSLNLVQHSAQGVFVYHSGDLAEQSRIVLDEFVRGGGARG